MQLMPLGRSAIAAIELALDARLRSLPIAGAGETLTDHLLLGLEQVLNSNRGAGFAALLATATHCLRRWESQRGGQSFDRYRSLIHCFYPHA